MGLSIAVFVPEGIVIASDGLSEIRNSEDDQAFLHHKQKRLFEFNNRFLLNIHGNGFVKGMPYAFYVEVILNKLKGKTFQKTIDFANSFSTEMEAFMGEGQNLSFYIVGIDDIDESTRRIPVLLLFDQGKLSRINCGIDNTTVFNYHAIGHSVWINKLLLRTSIETDDSNKIEFESADIDFSKYSLEDAIDFSKSLMTISRNMDNIAQLKQMVGNYISYGVISINGSLSICNSFGL